MSILDTFKKKTIGFRDKYVQQLNDVKKKREAEKPKTIFDKPKPVKLPAGTKVDSTGKPIGRYGGAFLGSKLSGDPYREELASLKEQPSISFENAPLQKALSKNISTSIENLGIHFDNVAADPSPTKVFRAAFSAGVEAPLTVLGGTAFDVAKEVPGGKVAVAPFEFVLEKVIDPAVNFALKPQPNEPKFLTDIKQDVLAPVFKTVLGLEFFGKVARVGKAGVAKIPKVVESIKYKGKTVPASEVRLVAEKVSVERPLNARETAIAAELKKLPGTERAAAIKGRAELRVKVPRNFFKDIQSRWKKTTGNNMPPEVVKLIDSITKKFPESAPRMKKEFNKILDKMESGLTQLKEKPGSFAGERFAFLEGMREIPAESVPVTEGTSDDFVRSNFKENPEAIVGADYEPNLNIQLNELTLGNEVITKNNPLFQDLKTAISKGEQMPPIRISVDPAGNIIVKDGNNRVVASRELGRTEIPASFDRKALERIFEDLKNGVDSKLTRLWKKANPSKISDLTLDIKKPSGLAKSVEAKAIEKGLTKGFEDLEGFTPITIKEQATKSDALVKKNFEMAKSVAFGLTEPPAGVKAISVWKAVEIKAIKEGDIDTLQKLASSKLSSAISESAQNLSILQDRNPESPVTAIRQVKVERERAVGKRLKKPLAQEKARVKAEIKKEIRKANTAETWEEFAQSIQC